jgi:hypothetical protein
MNNTEIVTSSPRLYTTMFELRPLVLPGESNEMDMILDTTITTTTIIEEDKSNARLS